MNTTTIKHLECRYLVPAEHPAPADLRSRLDIVAYDHLLGVCSKWLTQLLNSEDPSVWLIQQLNVDVSVDVGNMDTASLAEIWGRQVAMGIVRTLARGTDSETVKHFPNRVAYVGQFVSDLAAGQVWDKWYYRSFDSLRSLPISAAIRTILTREPGQIAEILAFLYAQRRLELVLSSLSEGDAQTVYELMGFGEGTLRDPHHVFGGPWAALRADPTGERPQRRAAQGPPLSLHSSPAPTRSPRCFPKPTPERDPQTGFPTVYEPPEGTQDAEKEYDRPSSGQTENGERQLVELLLSVWSKASLQFSGSKLATTYNALRLYAAMRQRVSTLPPEGVREIIEHLLRFAEVLRTITQPSTLIDYLVVNNLTAAIQLMRDSGMLSYLESVSFVQSVALGEESFIRRVASTVATSRPLVRAHDKRGSEDQDITTLLGGVFLLLPSFLDMKLHEFIETAPYVGVEEGNKAQVLRYLLLLKCFGLLYSEWSGIAHDPVLLLIAGLDDAPTSETLLGLSSSAMAEMNWACQRSLVARLAQRNHVEGRYLLAELVSIPSDDTVLLIRDIAHDSWVYARSVSTDGDDISDALISGLTLVQEAVDLPTEYLVVGPGLGDLPQLDELHNQHLRVVRTQLRVSTNEVDEAASPEFSIEELHEIPQEALSTLTRYLRRAKPAAKELAYLTLLNRKQPLVSNRDLDLTWSLVARALMRGFARRLMGFDQSSIEYLYHNFLAGTSTIRMQPGLIEVQLPCSPLHVVLRIAGMNGQSYTLPWLGDTQITLELSC